MSSVTDQEQVLILKSYITKPFIDGRRERQKGGRDKEPESFLQLSLDLVLVALEDSVELGGEHDGTLGLDLARHEQLLSVGLASSKIDEIRVRDIDGDIGLDTSDGSDVHGTGTVLQVQGPGTYFRKSRIKEKERVNQLY